MSASSAPIFRPPAPAFFPEQIVYHKADGTKGIVMSIRYTKRDQLYEVSWGHNSSGDHYAFELSTERPLDGIDTDDD